MTHTRASLVADLRRLGLSPGDIVMVHASVRSVGPVLGGPDEIHLVIEKAVSPGGTVMMLAGCPDGYDDVGRGHLSATQEAVQTKLRCCRLPSRRACATESGSSLQPSGRR